MLVRVYMYVCVFGQEMNVGGWVGGVCVYVFVRFIGCGWDAVVLRQSIR